ncbi:MAG: hypothetical protein VXZ94_03975, partial [Candidatus Thermoplasmatota archaeon]|nr:hypothetical protein [Candidatus Thermoplasmatota archaeon]
GNSESKHCIKLGEKTILISGIFSTSFTGFADGEEFSSDEISITQHLLVSKTDDSEGMIRELPSALWRLAEHLWAISKRDNGSNYPVQTKLI